jgi:hypothetical protein
MKGMEYLDSRDERIGEEMDCLTKEKKVEILDFFGRRVIEFRDSNLDISIDYATGLSVNQIKANQYGILATLSSEQREAINDLLSETITATIFDFLDMFEANADDMEIIIKKDGKEYNMLEISEKMGSEIACYEDNGWIQKFSRIGRFVL